MNQFQHHLQSVQAQIAHHSAAVQRPSASIQLLAVSKSQPSAALAAAIQCGQRCFGENYVQAAVAKINYWAAVEEAPPLQWHFIGRLQRNKLRLIATHFSWVQTLMTLEQAQQLNHYRAQTPHPPLQVLLQLNLQRSPAGYGVTPAALAPLVQALQTLPHLALRGLMVLPAATADQPQTVACFHHAQQLFQALQCQYPLFDTLSMGMSNDLPEAIAAGSTLLRIGSALFGPRLDTRR